MRELEKERANCIAESLGTHIPGSIHVDFWSLPILQALLDEVTRLKQRVEQLEKQ